MTHAPGPSNRADKRLHERTLIASGPSSSCSCSTVTLSSPAGDILVLRISGEVDSVGFPGLDAALDDVLDRRPYHLIVDVAELVSCSSRGFAAIARTARVAAETGIQYSMGGASPLFARLWPDYWPADEAPPIYRSTAAAVLSAVVRQADLWKPVPPTASRRLDLVANEGSPGGRPANIRRDTDHTDPAGPTGGRLLRPDPHGADSSVVRRALHRHRIRTYRGALHALGASYGAHPPGPDLAAQLRSALARFAATPPDNHHNGDPGAS